MTTAMLDEDHKLRAHGTRLASEGDALATDRVVVVVTTPAGTVRRELPASAQATVASVLDAIAAMERAPVLPAGEAAIFDAAGASDDRTAAATAIARSEHEFAALLAGALEVATAAEVLGLSEGRIRQRLNSERTLYGVKRGGDWRLPAFQFMGAKKKRRLVPGIEAVLPHIRVDAPPLAVARFFLQPHSDLVGPEDDDAHVPLSWLKSGGDPAAVAALAEEL